MFEAYGPFFSELTTAHLKPLGFKKYRHTYTRERDGYTEVFRFWPQEVDADTGCLSLWISACIDLPRSAASKQAFLDSFGRLDIPPERREVAQAFAEHLVESAVVTRETNLRELVPESPGSFEFAPDEVRQAAARVAKAIGVGLERLEVNMPAIRQAVSEKRDWVSVVSAEQPHAAERRELD
jgi:hypothetical protein